MRKGPGVAGLELRTLVASHAICRLGPGVELPGWAATDPEAILSVTRTDRELSIVCAEQPVPPGLRCSRGWRALVVDGELEHTLTGVLASLAAPLADAGIPIFAISSFDTDYVLVPGARLSEALEALEAAGHSIAR